MRSRLLLARSPIAATRRLSLAHGISQRSSGVIFDPYTFVPEDQRPSTFSVEGIKYRLVEAKSVAKSSYSSAFIQRHIPGFSHRSFPAVANEVFIGFMNAYRSGDASALRLHSTDGIREGIQQELKAAQLKALPPSKKVGSKSKAPQATGLRSAFTVEGFVVPTQVIQMRHGFTTGLTRSMDTGFGQVTCLVQSTRRVVQVDCSSVGVAIAQQGPASGGSGEGGAEWSAEGRLVHVPSLVVFEVGFGDSRQNWRVARVEEIGSRTSFPASA
jgi:hypothetical protein